MILANDIEDLFQILMSSMFKNAASRAKLISWYSAEKQAQPSVPGVFSDNS